MLFLSVLEAFNYTLVLFFGIFLSLGIAGNSHGSRQRWIFAVVSLVLFALQGACFLIGGVEIAKRLYPLVVHLPLALALTLLMKKRWNIALVSICTAYLCCQIPRWVSLVALALTASPLVEEILYTVSIIPSFYLLWRYFAPAAHSAMTYSKQTMLIFGSLPLAYYVFDYATVVYSDVPYREAAALYEFLPTVLVVFYVLFLSLYHVQLQKKTEAEIQNTMLETELTQSNAEMEQLRATARQTAVYQHDMRHHLQFIGGYLAADKVDEATEYIRRICDDVEAVQLHRYCENEAVNLLCSSFVEKAENRGIRLAVEARVDKKLPLSDTELCSVLSNGLENAIQAVEGMPEPYRHVDLYCAEKNNNLLIEIRNPCDRAVTMVDGLPSSDRPGHGYGCRSIRTIVQSHRGHCLFQAKEGMFTLRVAIPL